MLTTVSYASAVACSSRARGECATTATLRSRHHAAVSKANDGEKGESMNWLLAMGASAVSASCAIS